MSQPEFEYLGPYRVERTLGRGGMGTVYKGVHARSGEVVAVKVIATGVANQSRFRRRFASEVETLKRLKHPNIVSLVGYGEEQGLLFYSMEYVEGHSLHEHLRQHAKLPWEDVVEVAIQTSSALKHAHDLGIIHRDLKPANLMLDADSQVKLTDFGIAKLFGSTDMTAAGSVIGTADYMPPEQAEGKGVTIRSDLYSLGGVIYALLVGKAPFGGKSVPEVLYSVRYNPVPSLQERLPEAPAALCELVHQLLEKDPQKRPPTALVVGNRLKSLQQGMKKVRKLGAQLPEAESEQSPEKIGTQLTSLDLSDVEDDELKLTGEEAVGEPDSAQAGADDAPVESLGLGTHEQQTMLAPEDLEIPSAAGSSADGVSMPSAAKPSNAGDFSHAGLEDEVESTDAPLSSGGPSHYTPISDDEARPFSFSAETDESSDGWDWIQVASIAGMVALLLGSVGLGWWMLQPQSADKVYTQILTAVESGDDSQLLSAKGSIDEFLGRFPDDERSAEVQSYADEIELTRSTRVLERRASRSGGRRELTVIEQGFLDCMKARAEDFDLAEQKLTAFLKVFGPLEDLPRGEQRLVELAEFAKSMGRAQERNTPVAVEQLRALVSSAENALADERLKDYYQDLLLLYGDKAWASEQIERIRNKLETEF